MKRRKPVVGETLYSLNVGTAAWHGIKQELTPVVVVSVGRKYFKAAERRMINRPTTYHLDRWGQKTDYAPDSLLYESTQEWEDEKEVNAIVRKVEERFRIGRVHGVPLCYLRQIQAILDAADAENTPRADNA